MPRTPKLTPSKIYDGLKDFNFMQDDHYLPSNDSVWQMASDKLNKVMNKNYVYMYITQNRNGVASRIHKHGPPQMKPEKHKIGMNRIGRTTSEKRNRDSMTREMRSKMRSVRTKDHDDNLPHDNIPAIIDGKKSSKQKNSTTKIGEPSSSSDKINTVPEMLLTLKGGCPNCHTDITLHGSAVPIVQSTNKD